MDILPAVKVKLARKPALIAQGLLYSSRRNRFSKEALYSGRPSDMLLSKPAPLLFFRVCRLSFGQAGREARNAHHVQAHPSHLRIKLSFAAIPQVEGRPSLPGAV